MKKKQRKNIDCENRKSYEENKLGVLNEAVERMEYKCKKKRTSTSEARGRLK